MESTKHLLDENGYPIVFINRKTAIDRARARIEEATNNVDKEEEALNSEIKQWELTHK